jgi:hypothetical protein
MRKPITKPINSPIISPKSRAFVSIGIVNSAQRKMGGFIIELLRKRCLACSCHCCAFEVEEPFARELALMAEEVHVEAVADVDCRC